VLGVERGETHEAVHALLAAQPAVGVRSAQLDGGVLDARLVAQGAVDHVGLDAVTLRPAQVHALEHLGPVLRLGAAGAGEDLQDGVAVVVGTGEGVLELERIELALQRQEVALQRLGEVRLALVLGFRELDQLQPVVDAALQATPGLEGLLLLGEPPHVGAGGVLVVPEGRCGGLLLEVRDLPLDGGQVKDAPARP